MYCVKHCLFVFDGTQGSFRAMKERTDVQDIICSSDSDSDSDSDS